MGYQGVTIAQGSSGEAQSTLLCVGTVRELKRGSPDPKCMFHTESRHRSEAVNKSDLAP